MSAIRFHVAVLVPALLLGACSAGIGGQTAGGATGARSFAPSSFSAVDTGAGAMVSTGTVVGRRTAELRQDLNELQQSIASSTQQLQEIRAKAVGDAEEYHRIIAGISARLQVGTTPGNPILVAQWGDAQIKLDDMSSGVARLNTLAGTVAADSTVAAYLLDSVRATYGLAGAVDEDHNQLAILEDEVNRTVVQIDRLLNEVSNDINRQTSYLATERSNLRSLQVGITNGELYSTSLANQAFFNAAPPPAPSPARPVNITPAETRQASATPAALTAAASSRPLVMIRFDRPNVEYRQAVYQAVSQALQRRSDARFELVALSPEGGDPASSASAANAARTSAEDVKRTLVTLGLPANRLSVSTSRSPDVVGPEVHIFVR